MITEAIKLLQGRVITKDEYIIYQYIAANPNVLVEELMQVFANVDIEIKVVLRSLYNKKLITIINNKNLQVVTDEVVVNKGQEKEIISLEQLDQIRVLLNREIKSFELEDIKRLCQKYDFHQLVNAIQKAGLKGIDNLKYIEKILENNQNQMTKKKDLEIVNKVEKKFDFFQ